MYCRRLGPLAQKTRQMASLKDRSLLAAMPSIYDAFFGIENSPHFVKKPEATRVVLGCFIRTLNEATVTDQRAWVSAPNGATATGYFLSGCPVENGQIWDLQGCFRHQVLLRRTRHVHDGSSGHPARVSERQHVAQRRNKAPQRHEDVPQGQPPRGESCLHRGSPRLASELQRPMGSNEVVVAAQQFEVRLERVRRPRMGERPS